MTTRAPQLLLSLALFLSAAASQAGEYLVTGAEIAGHASVTPAAGGVHVAVTVRGFGKQAGKSWAGNGTQSASGLSFKAATGTQALKATANGQLTGTLGGIAQTWTPMKSTKGLVILAVPGLSTNGWNKVGIPYLDENVAALNAYGFSARRVDIKTEASVDTNAVYLQNQIRTEAARGNKVLLFAHSKGAVDATAALALEPALTSSVVGLIAIQPVWVGSPIAEMVASSGVLEASVKLVVEKLMKGSKDAVLDLDFARRKSFQAAHPYPIAKVPTVVVRSTFNRSVSKSPLWANQKYISSKYKKPNDGMVMFDDQAIPGALATIDLENMDHFEPGLRNESKNTPLIVTTKALLAILPKL